MNQVANTVMIPVEEYNELKQQRDELQHQLAGITDSAKHFSDGMKYYRGLIDEAAKSIGIAMYTADDQGVHPDPLRAKLPECVAELVQQRDELLTALERICEADSDIGMWGIASETLTNVKEQK